MAIRNYTSKKSPLDTIGKIQKLLANHNAREVSMRYGNNQNITSITFKMEVNGLEVPFNLSVNPEGMLRALEEDDGVPASKCNINQARRTAWKNKYDWLHSQMAEIATNQARIEQLLLGYAVTPEGDTLFEHIQSNQNLLPSHNGK